MANSPVSKLSHTGVSLTGTTVELGADILDRREIAVYMTETAITKGQVVAADIAKMAADPSGGYTSLTAITADFNSAPVQKCVVGVALESITGTAGSPKQIRVVVRGPADSVPFVAATAVGAPLCLDEAGAAGSAQVYVAASVGRIFATALTATGGAAPGTVFVHGR